MKNLSLSALASPERPTITRYTATHEDAYAAIWRLRGEVGYERRFIGVAEGRRMRTREAFFGTMTALLQAPSYVGHSWNAFVDVIGDLGWLRADLVLLVFMDGPEILSEADPDEPGLLVKTLCEASTHWAKGTALREPVPFRVIYHSTPEHENELEHLLRAHALMLRPM